MTSFRLPLPAAAQATPLLGSAHRFAVLSAATTLHGDLGVDPGTAITGLDSITLIGTVHHTDGHTALAVVAGLAPFALAGLAWSRRRPAGWAPPQPVATQPPGRWPAVQPAQPTRQTFSILVPPG